MNPNQIWSALRFGMSFGGGILVGKGYLTTDQLNTAINSASAIWTEGAALVGPVLALIALVGHLVANTKKAVVAKAADIVQVSPQAQASVGITQPQLVPTNPKAPA